MVEAKTVQLENLKQYSTTRYDEESTRSVSLLILFRGESLIWVGYHNLGQHLAPKRIEIENPATFQIEDNLKAFPKVP